MNELNEVYRYVVHGECPTIKQTIETHINILEPGTRLNAKELWWKLFRYKVARNSVTRALGQLAKEKKIEKVNQNGGRSSNWRVL